ncbi:C39 family peptidase [Variovorax rhizosphaerae]|uniref:C39 family peptidase n=2 Tax=Variovorax rhizosphaerae TaxID=1836200 RepID=A0ABU8WGQ7_9BURK
MTLAATAASAPAQQAYFPGIGGGGDVTLPVTNMRQAKFKTTLLQKYDFSCGSAAVATLLTHHFSYPVTEQAVFEEMYAQGDQQKIQKEGFSLFDMKRYLANHGFVADGFKQPLEKLNEARVPAIVLINENGYHHFVVIKGVQADRVLVGDPAQGTRAIPRHVFEKRWGNKLLFVVHNRMDIARFNLAADWRVAPRAPVGDGVDRGSMTAITLPKMGPGDF